ncbi:hypothetical protein BH20BAC1_BH20BAC1_13600 [soil metagenome]
MLKRFFVFISVIFIFFIQIRDCKAQYDAPLYTSYTTKTARAKLHDRLIKNSITRNLTFPLSDSTEENWEEAFNGMELLIFKTPLTKVKIEEAFSGIQNRSIHFQTSLVEAVYALYPTAYEEEVFTLLQSTNDLTVFAMCTEYILQQNPPAEKLHQLSRFLQSHFTFDQSDPIYTAVLQSIEGAKSGGKAFISKQNLKLLLSPGFLRGNILMYSFQRKDRDYPGLVLVRNAYGGFSTDSTGQVFHVPQLARSISNLPFYFKGGNTPQGIFLMYGFGVSMSSFIGPSANIQMVMPVELSIRKFLRDSAIYDSVWHIDYYKSLLPAKFLDCLPLYESYTAGAIGRNEIIAHGTAIDPEYYTDQVYYPLTPSRGCLCTKEIWNGNRLSSDQQKLVNALLKAGGANGYCVVIEIDDKKEPVTLEDILPYIPK